MPKNKMNLDEAGKILDRLKLTEPPKKKKPKGKLKERALDEGASAITDPKKRRGGKYLE